MTGDGGPARCVLETTRRIVEPPLIGLPIAGVLFVSDERMRHLADRLHVVLAQPREQQQ